MKIPNKDILFITTLHGNETTPSSALSSEKIAHLVGNPKAIEKNVRYVDMDMNKAFQTGGGTYEEIMARELLTKIKSLSPSYIIDFHTTSATTEPFAIIVDRKMLPQAQTLGVKHVVYMKHNIKSGHSLIDHYPGVSVEAGTHGTDEAFQNTLAIAHAALAKESQPVRLYEVYDIIKEEGDYRNFVLHKEGFIPVLAGEISYPFYGLMAKEVETLDEN